MEELKKYIGFQQPVITKVWLVATVAAVGYLGFLGPDGHNRIWQQLRSTPLAKFEGKAWSIWILSLVVVYLSCTLLDWVLSLKQDGD